MGRKYEFCLNTLVITWEINIPLNYFDMTSFFISLLCCSQKYLTLNQSIEIDTVSEESLQQIKAMVFPVVMYRCESWTIKAESWRPDPFELWGWRRLLRVPWTTKSNESILKQINSEQSLEGLMLKLRLQHFGHLMPRADSLEKPLMLGKIEGKRRRGW